MGAATAIEIIAQAREFIKWDRDPSSRSEVQRLLLTNDIPALTDRFAARIQFGTAGLRAEMGSGYARMNALTVIQTTQYILRTNRQASIQGVVIGHDHRHNSLRFARLTAAVFLSRGVKVYLYNKLVHTPMPFGVKHLGAASGVMITASHNPKQDNGYKLYYSNACQIVPPHDSGISHSILANLEPTDGSWCEDMREFLDNGLLVDVGPDVEDAYYASLERYVLQQKCSRESGLKICYTAMHGVGLAYAQRVMSVFGLPPLYPVHSQCQPDPDFPTVKFPNPEEKGAFNEAISEADKICCQLIVANDPDADRFAMAEKTKSGWRVFTGNEIGALLAVIMIERFAIDRSKKYAMLTSTVSSKLLQRIADKESMHFEETLTGFKWIGNRALELSDQGYTCLFAFEEAIGFMVGDTVADKDGISALGVMCSYAHELYASDKTLSSKLSEIYERYGWAVSCNGYVVSKDASKTLAMFDAVRYGGGDGVLRYPVDIAGLKVLSVRDLTIGYDSGQIDMKPVLPVSASTQMITFRFENGAAITVRTSGTEPKIKFYSEYFGASELEARSVLDKLIEGFLEEVIRAKDFGFEISQ